MGARIEKEKDEDSKKRKAVPQAPKIKPVVSPELRATDMIEDWFAALELTKKQQKDVYDFVENVANKAWFAIVEEDLSQTDPFKLLEEYASILVKHRVLQEEEINISQKEDSILIHITGEHLPIVTRPRQFTFLLEEALNKVYDVEEKDEGSSTIITLTPGTLSLKVLLSPKVQKGSVKVSGKDINKMGLGIIEDVLVVPVGKDTGLVEMMFAESKIRSGLAVMNNSDAVLAGIKSGDMVTLQRREAEMPLPAGAEDEAGSEEESDQESGKGIEEKPEEADGGESEETDDEASDEEESDDEESDDEASDEEESDDEESDDEETDDEETDDEESDDEETDEEESDDEETDDEEADDEETDDEEADDEETDAEETDDEETDAEESDDEESDADVEDRAKVAPEKGNPGSRKHQRDNHKETTSSPKKTTKGNTMKDFEAQIDALRDL